MAGMSEMAGNANKITGANSRSALPIESRRLRSRALVVERHGHSHGGVVA